MSAAIHVIAFLCTRPVSAVPYNYMYDMHLQHLLLVPLFPVAHSLFIPASLFAVGCRRPHP
jgi:hypothetical protein